MKKLFAVVCCVVVISGCNEKKPVQLKPSETIQTIRAEFKAEEVKVQAEFRRKKALIQAGWAKEMAEAKRLGESGMISWEAYQDREYDLNKQYKLQLWDLEDRVEKRFGQIEDRFDGKYAAWEDRK